MIEIRYENQTKRLTALRGNPERFGNLEREGHTVVMLDIPIPKKPIRAWLYDGQKLIPNPDYVEPEPLRDLVAEIDALKEEIEKLKRQRRC